MALSSTIVWEVQTGGSSTNGGGFNSAASGVDYSQSTSPHATLTTSSVVNADTTKITVFAANYTVALTDIGNVFFLTGGTATSGYYEITGADTVGNTWTLDRSVGTAGQTCPGKMGGCLAFPWDIKTAVVSGNITYIKTGTYSTSATQTFSTSATLPEKIRWIGYTSTRGDSASSRPLLNFTSNFLQFSGLGHNIENVDVTGNATSTITLANIATTLYNCTILNNSGTANRAAISMSGSGNYILKCNLRSSSGNGITFAASVGSCTIHSCYFHDSVIGVFFTANATSPVSNNFINNIFNNCNTGLSLNARSYPCMFYNTIYGSSVVGIISNSNLDQGIYYYNSISSCLVGINYTVSTRLNANYNNFYNNGTDRVNVIAGDQDTALDPQFVNAGSGDFRVGSNMIDQANPGFFLGANASGVFYPTKGAMARKPSTGGAYVFSN